MLMDKTQLKFVRLRKPERNQVVMSVQSPDGLIAMDHPARLIWQVAGRLDLSRFYDSIQAVEGSVGRDATDPRLLVSLWLYAATRGVGSARELARRCGESRPYQWLCGGVSVNHHTLSDFRVSHGAALDELLTQVIAALVQRKLIKVYRISQDGTRVRACAGASSFRRKERLELLLKQAKDHVQELKALLEDPAKSAGLSARHKAARKRAARERQERLEKALAKLPALAQKQEKLAQKVSAKDKKKGKLKEPRASTTDDQAKVMKMPDGGFRPAVNVQIASDTQSRAILGVSVVDQGVDTTNQLQPMRQQVQERSGQEVKEHLADGGYLKLQEVQEAQEQNVSLYIPPKPPRNKEQRASEYEPMPSDSEVIRQWRQRMGSAQGQRIYRQRASTSETINADLKSFRGLVQLTVRGLAKAQCVALWSALAYNLMHFGQALLA
jgi:transposase